MRVDRLNQLADALSTKEVLARIEAIEKSWDGHPTPREAAALLRKHADQKGLPPQDNDYSDAARVIEALVIFIVAAEVDWSVAHKEGDGE